MSIINKIKEGVKNSGNNKAKILYFKPDSKVRIRFLQEIENGIEITNHDSFQEGINFFDQEKIKGRKHPMQEDENLRHREAYVWSVWDYDAKEVKLFIGYANNFSPLPSLVAMYEAYDTIKDRDYIIQRDGKQTNTRYSVIPMDKVKFKNAKAKPYSEKKTLEILDKAFPAPKIEDEDDEDQNEETGTEEEEEDEEVETDYDDMKPKELYLECVERGLKAKKKQKKSYYIDILTEDDLEDDDDDWDEDDEDEDDEW